MVNRTGLTEIETNFVHVQRVARLATADEQGSPYLVPVCYAFDGRYFYTPLDEKPKRVAGTSLRRERNIEVRPEVSLLIDRYDDDWSHLGYVLVHGHAALLAPDKQQHSEALILLRERYIQYHNMKLEEQPMIVITAQHVVSWGPALQ